MHVVDFDFLSENLDSGCVLSHFVFYLSTVFITLRPNCDILMLIL